MNTLNLELFLHTLVMLVLSMGTPPDVQWVATTPLDTRATWTMACNELVFLLNLWLLLQPRVRHSKPCSCYQDMGMLPHYITILIFAQPNPSVPSLVCVSHSFMLSEGRTLEEACACRHEP